MLYKPNNKSLERTTHATDDYEAARNELIPTATHTDIQAVKINNKCET